MEPVYDPVCRHQLLHLPGGCREIDSLKQQEIADYVGDSFYLSKIAAESEAEKSLEKILELG